MQKAIIRIGLWSQRTIYSQHVVVARKIEQIFRNSFEARESLFYDHLVSQLFINILHRYTRNRIYFAQRGTRPRQAHLEGAIRRKVESG